ncbi:MAG: L,D-transpeptidase [Chelatococcus sp.]|jgi:lipoprotein-anchoring transpeptidase ErfK/SrfK|uniref:L,D-transpeptidase n=1 Tax=unclassified Chelatococcus TaxID=2638111 RepID=UPI001BCB7289|nr:MULTISPECIES: L,D-transpeptidase [unclassified Chelatococcus]CAH1648504.1 L,D-transpeptidase-like protein [Hyphomicrobiales bacterium]MBS7739447.1 L,D-transpeptidase [Chelatococcus sp. HY11]MBX3536494.1 L,D-transpeptidase [Chelatococcus sp.]MBX3543816.1 L,D-transpeptidase [Chelatococcus sp.]MCO5076017.1 L,D-transpeptidase [Chelatococcus sp.]
MRLKTSLAVLLSASVLAGCNFKTVPDPAVSSRDTEWMAQMPKAPVDPLFARYEIDDPTGEKPGTIVVKQKERQLYYVLPNKRAMRYGVAVGDEAYGWTGNATVQRKAEWPNWNPPAEMKERWPHVRATAGGPNNPLGARALYLYDDKGRDTLYRIHGTNEPDKIGQAVSSGCIRMRNLDVIDLYNRVEPGSRVVVM